VDQIFHPFSRDRHSSLNQCLQEVLLTKAMEEGKIVGHLRSPDEASSYAKARLAQCSSEHKRFEYPHTYKVGISSELMNLRSKIVEELQQTIS